MSNNAVLTRNQFQLLVDLHEAGGSGTIDMHGRVCCGPTKAPLRGSDTIAWLRLVAAGLVCGEDGRILLTQVGRERATAASDGHIRHAS